MFNPRQWRRLHEAAIRDRNEERFFEDVRSDIREAKYNDNEFSIRDIWDTFVEDGRELRESWSPRSGGGQSGVQLMEAGVNTAAFANITGQIVFSRVLEVFESPVWIGPQLVTTVPTDFSGEKIPGVTQIGDEIEAISEAKPYPLAGVSEEWIDTPATTKRGVIVPVTKEAIFFDRTGLVLERARQVGESLAINKEKRILDCVLGITSTYRRNGGTAIATYGDNSGAHDWDNLIATNALADWTDIDNALLAFEDLLDPNTGEPIVVQPDKIVVPGALLSTAMRIINATEIRQGDGATAGYVTISSNPVGGRFQVLSNQYVKARTSSTSTWFIGQFNRAFYYMENWPVATVQAPSNSELEFTHDIVQRFKVSERGTPAVIEPRRAAKCTA